MAFTGGVESIMLPLIPVCVMSSFAMVPKHGEKFGTGLAVCVIIAYLLLLLVPDEWNELPSSRSHIPRIALFVFSILCAVLVSVHGRRRSRIKKRIALEASNLAAERAEHTKNALIANISHEFRTPINAAVGAAQLIALEAPFFLFFLQTLLLLPSLSFLFSALPFLKFFKFVYDFLPSTSLHTFFFFFFPL